MSFIMLKHCAKITRIAVFGFSVTQAILFLLLKCYNGAEEVIHVIRIKDSRQQLTFILEDIRAIRSVALMADEEPDWNAEGDVVRLIALATEPIMNRLEEVISTLDDVISEKAVEYSDVATE